MDSCMIIYNPSKLFGSLRILLKPFEWAGQCLSITSLHFCTMCYASSSSFAWNNYSFSRGRVSMSENIFVISSYWSGTYLQQASVPWNFQKCNISALFYDLPLLPRRVFHPLSHLTRTLEQKKLCTCKWVILVLQSRNYVHVHCANKDWIMDKNVCSNGESMASSLFGRICDHLYLEEGSDFFKTQLILKEYS